MSKVRFVLAGLAVAAFAVNASAQERQLLNGAIRVDPIAVASVRIVDGQYVVGEWQTLVNPVDGCFSAEHYDAFDPDSTGFPEDEDGCGLGSGRWFFGPSYCQGASTNDIVDATDNAQSTATSFAWHWYCSGSGTERCVMVLFTGGVWDNDCVGFSDGYDGVAYDFGAIGCNPGGYYYTNADLTGTGLFHQMPPSGNGWYQIDGWKDDTGTPATCWQPMLWGSDNVAGGGRPGGPEEKGQWDDIDFSHSYSADECFDNTFACPTVLGSAVCFGDNSDNCGGGSACDAVVTKVIPKKGPPCTIVVVKGTDATFGDTFDVTLSDGSTKTATANDRGKWKAKFTGKNIAAGGSITGSACGSNKTGTCN